MDRKINQKSRLGGKALKGVALLVLVLLLLWKLSDWLRAGASREDLRTEFVEMERIQAVVSATGTLVPDLEQSLVSPTTTRIGQVHAQPGQIVVAGDLLLQLDTKLANAELKRLDEEVALKATELRSRLLEIEESSMQKAARIELLNIDLRSRQTRARRLEKLASTGGVSADELLEAQLNVQRTEIEIQQTKDELSNVRSRREADEERLRLEQSILTSRRETQFQRVQQLDVVAPGPGVVTWIHDSSGVSVTEGELLARVAGVNAFAATASVSDFYAPRLAPGQRVHVRSSSGQMYGRLARILPDSDATTLTLFIELENPEADWLKANLRVEIEVVVAERLDTLVLKRGPGVSAAARQDVFVIRGDTAFLTQISTGLSNEREIEILAGLAAGDEVIVSDTSAFNRRTSLKID